MILTNGKNGKIIHNIECNRTNCDHKSECLVMHPVDEKGRTGTFYPRLKILFYGKFIVSCDHYLKGGD